MSSFCIIFALNKKLLIMNDLTGQKAKFTLPSGKQGIGIISMHDTDSGLIIMHTMIDIDTLQPIKGRFGGIQFHINNITIVTL